MTQSDIINPQDIEAIIQNIPQEEYPSRFLFDLFVADKIDHDIARLIEDSNPQFTTFCHFIPEGY
jgi:hypothetical protein